MKVYELAELVQGGGESAGLEGRALSAFRGNMQAEELRLEAIH